MKHKFKRGWVQMMKEMSSYWNDSGNYMEELYKLNTTLPNWGMTDNKYMNLFILASKIYYDVYNNGGCNLKDTFQSKIVEYIIPLADDLKSMQFNVSVDTIIKNFKNKKKLETFLDEVILYVKDQDLNYDKYTLYFDNEQKKLSKAEVEGFSVITFGNNKDYEDWMNFRINNWNYKWNATMLQCKWCEGSGVDQEGILLGNPYKCTECKGTGFEHGEEGKRLYHEQMNKAEKQLVEQGLL